MDGYGRGPMNGNFAPNQVIVPKVGTTWKSLSRSYISCSSDLLAPTVRSMRLSVPFSQTRKGFQVLTIQDDIPFGVFETRSFMLGSLCVLDSRRYNKFHLVYRPSRSISSYIASRSCPVISSSDTHGVYFLRMCGMLRSAGLFSGGTKVDGPTA